MTIMKTETVSLEATVFTCDMESLHQPESNPDKYEVSYALEEEMANFGYRAYVYKQLVKNPNPSTDEWEDSYMYEYSLEIRERVSADETADVLFVKDGERVAFFGWQSCVKLP